MLMTCSQQLEENMSRKILGLFYKCPINKLYPIEVDGEKIGYIYKTYDKIGVLIDNLNNVSINESFHLITIENIRLNTESGLKNCLALFCTNKNLYDQFSHICEDFLCSDRILLLENPYGWYENWKNLMGDIMSNKKVYDILAEILAFRYYKSKDSSMLWKIDEAKTHDIEGKYFDVEVKSSLNKYRNEIKISGQHQLKPSQNKELKLFFIKFEPSDKGICINEILEKFNDDEKKEYTKRLEYCGLYKGNKKYYEKYNILSIQEYLVDSNFPRIDEDSFVSGNYPKHITKIQYTIELSGLDSLSINGNDVLK